MTTVDDVTEELGSGPKQGHFEMTSERPGHTHGVVEAAGKEPFELDFDESPPLGRGEYPSPVTYMFGSLIACQLAVLGRCLEKARVEEFDIEADASVDRRELGEVAEEMPPNTAKRVRHIDIDLTLTVPEEYESRAQRCLEVYDTGCIVGQSFKAGIDYTPHTHLEVAGD